MTEKAKGGYPPQIPYIIGNEACERFSFYGMRNVLTVFLVTQLLLHLPEADRASSAKEVFHVFVMGVYFFPLLGGWLADRYLGKYRTIFWLSLLYCVGHLCLAVFESNLQGFYVGLFLIALGSGGIKPCVSSFVGDQFDSSNKDKARKIFDLFYWVINFGSFFASLLIPLVLKNYGPHWAFGIPGILMGVALLIFWLGRHKYTNTPPTKSDPHSFLRVVKTAVFAEKAGAGRPALWILTLGGLLTISAFAFVKELGFVATICLGIVIMIASLGAGSQLQLERAKGQHPDDAIEGVRSVLRILVIFALVTPFWSLFDQKASTWILQAGKMQLEVVKEVSQMQALNPLLVVLLIPFNNMVLYPMLERMGLRITPLRKMTVGIVLAGISWIVVGSFQTTLDEGQPLSILWQILPYCLLTLGEVLVSATGLEFAYSQAPARMKGTIMSFWSLSVTVGSLWVLLVNSGVKTEGFKGLITQSGLSETAFQMYFFAGFAFVAAVAFGLFARRYPMKDNYRRVS